MKNQQGMRGAKRLLMAQIIFTVAFALLSMSFYGHKAALSVCCGALVSILPNAYFARTLFAIQGAKRARQIVSRFYKGEAIKIAMSIILFALVFKCVDIIPLVFFGAFIVIQAILWLAPMLFSYK